MNLSAIDLKEFYLSMRGRVVRRVLRQQIRRFWPDVKGQNLLGFGYAVPYLKPFMGEAARVTALMPAQQGAVFWPAEGEGLVTICNEGDWPVESNSIERLLVIHTMNSAESVHAILHEAWRVLAGQGRVLIIVPNRSGIWARLDNTPFGHGTPYSTGQVRQLLRDYMFVPEHTERALFFPPTSSRLMLAAAPVWEKIGRRLFNAFGGVNVVEATKQLYAGTPVSVTAAQRRFSTVPKPVSTVSNLE